MAQTGLEIHVLLGHVLTGDVFAPHLGRQVMDALQRGVEAFGGDAERDGGSQTLLVLVHVRLDDVATQFVHQAIDLLEGCLGIRHHQVERGGAHDQALDAGVVRTRDGGPFLLGSLHGGWGLSGAEFRRGR